MAHRQIGQEEMFSDEGSMRSPDGLDAGIDWSRIEARLAGACAGRLGHPRTDPICQFADPAEGAPRAFGSQEPGPDRMALRRQPSAVRPKWAPTRL